MLRVRKVVSTLCFRRVNSLLLCCFFLALIGCSKSDTGNAEGEGDRYAKFSNAAARTGGDTDSINIYVRWSKSKWSLSVAEGGFITGFSSAIGGDEEKMASSSSVAVRLKVNLEEQSRQQVITLKDLSSGAEEKMVITQEALSGNKIVLNPAARFQKVTGFGGMLNPSWTGNNLTEADVQKLYGDLGYNIIRMMLYPDRSQWGLNTVVAKKAQSLGALVFASPWTPPAAMKSNGLNTNVEGAYLLPEKYADFAGHLKGFVDYQKERGLNIYAVSLQNEPDWKVDYDGCSWTPEQMVSFVRDYGDKVGTKLMAAETVNNLNKRFTNALLNDPVAVNKVDVVATHLYGGGIQDDPLVRTHGKEFWMTEHSINESHKNAGDPEINWTWKPSLDLFGKELHDCMAANVTGYVWWYLKRYYSMMADSDSRNFVAPGEITKRGYIMAHYAKYATGRTRIGLTNFDPNQLWVTAYAGTNDFTAVLINRSASARALSIDIPSNMLSVDGIETTETKNMTPADFKISGDKKSVKVQLPAQSIVSLKISI